MTRRPHARRAFRPLAPCRLGLAVMLASAPIHAADLIKSAESIVEVRCTHADGVARGTAFHIGSPGSFATCYHVAACCDQISAFSETANRRSTSSCTIERAFPGADLAVLRCDGLSDLPLLTIADRDPSPGDKVFSIGYHADIPTWKDSEGTVRHAPGELWKYVPKKVRDKINKNGFPNEGAIILPLQCPLRPGTSGSPIISEQGLVCGVAQGGIDGGATDLTWAIRRTELKQLFESSPPVRKPNCETIWELFSFDENALDVDERAQIAKLGPRTFQRIVAEADDPAALLHIINDFKEQNDRAAEHPDRLAFLRFRDVATGVVFYVPDAVSAYRAAEKGVEYSAPNLPFSIRVVRAVGCSRQQISENEILPETAHAGWERVRQFSYSAPKIGPGGFTVMRTYSVNRESRKSMMRTELWRNDYYFCICAINHNYPVNPSDAALMRLWLSSCISVVATSGA